MGVLNPGTTTWVEAIPVFVLAGALLFIPGGAAAVVAGLRPLAAAIVAPVLTTAFLTFSGIVTGGLGIHWTPLVLVGTLGSCVAIVGTTGRVLSRGRDRPEDGPRLATIGSVAAALAILFVSIHREIRSPEAIPQHPDTIFHLGAAQRMLEIGDISVLHAGGFSLPSGTGFYPAAFHDFTASIAMLTGTSVAAASSIFAILVAGVVWPLGCVGLALCLLGRRPEVALSAGIASVLFTGYPYFLMGYGVLWPNLFGQALLPAILLLVLSAFGSDAKPPYAAASPGLALAFLFVSIPALVLAHPSAFVVFCILTALIAVGRIARHLSRRRDEPRSLIFAGSFAVAVLVVGGAGLALRPGSMFKTGGPGPEASQAQAWHDTLQFSPRGAEALSVLAIVVLLGAAALLARGRGARWVVVALVAFLSLFWLNVAVDSSVTRFFTWPWYNNSVRIQSVAILPAVLCVSAAFVHVADFLTRFARWRHASTVIGTSLVLMFLYLTHGYVSAHAHILHQYFHPKSAESWVTDTELQSLRTLSSHIPTDAVVAANPWKGGTYLYVVSGIRLLVPTEKGNIGPDRQLLSLRLNDVGADPKVCVAAEREHVAWALTGGTPFSWAGDGVLLYSGIDHVDDSAAWRRVAAAPPYTLYERVACAGQNR